MQTWFKGLLVVLMMGAGLGALVLTRALSPEAIAGRVERELAPRVGGPVRVDSASLSTSGALTVDHIHAGVAGLPGWSLDIALLSTQVDTGALLAGKLVLGPVKLEHPRFTLDADLTAPPATRVRLPRPTIPPDDTPVVALEPTVTVSARTPAGHVALELSLPKQSLDLKKFSAGAAPKADGSRSIALPAGLEAKLAVAAPGGAPLALAARVRAGRIAGSATAVSLEDAELELEGPSVPIVIKPVLKVTDLTTRPKIELELPPTRLAAKDLVAAFALTSGSAPRLNITSGEVELVAAVQGPTTGPELAGELRIMEVGIALPNGFGQLTVRRGSLIATPDAGKGLLVTPQRLHITLERETETRQILIERGDVLLTTDSVVLHDLAVRAAEGKAGPDALSTGAGGPPGPRVEISGTSKRGPDGTVLDLKITGQNADLRAAAAIVDPALALGLDKLEARLNGDLKLQVTGLARAPEIRGTITLDGGKLRLGTDKTDPEATVLPGGKIELEGRTARLKQVQLLVKGLPVDVSGTISGGDKGQAASGSFAADQDGKVDDVVGGPDAARPALRARSGQRLDLALSTVNADAKQVVGLLTPDPDVAKTLSGKAAKVSLELKGPPGTPPGALAFSLAGVHFALAELPAPLIVTAGEGTLGGGKLTLTGVKAEMQGSPLELSGTMELATKKLDLAVKSKSLPATIFAKTIPDSITVTGAAPADLKITGTRKDPVITGKLPAAGLAGRWSHYEKQLTATKGTIELEANGVRLKGLELGGASETARIDAHLVKVGGAMHAKPMRIDAALELSRLTPWPAGMNVSGPARVKMSFEGAMAQPTATGTLIAPGARVMQGDRPLEISDLAADLDLEDGELAIPKFRARTMGAKFQGSVEVDGAFTLRGEALALKPLIGATEKGMLQDGSLTFEVSGNSGGSLADLDLKGKIQIDGLVLDLSQNEKLKSMRTKAGAGEAASTIGSALLSTTGLSFLAGASAAQTHFFVEVLNEALDVHTMGKITSPLTVSGGEVHISALTGENVKGHADVQLGSNKLSGKLDFIQFGEARFLDVELAGTLSDPEPSVSATSVRLGGKGPPGGKNGGKGSMNLKTLVKPAAGLILGPVVPVADFLLPRLFGKKKRRKPRPSPSPEASPEPEPE